LNKTYIKAGIFRVLQRGIIVFFGFLGFIVLIGLLSKEEYGTWVLFILVSNILEAAKKGFIQNGLMKFLLECNEENRGNIQSNSLVLNFILSLPIILLLIFFAKYLSLFWDAPHLESLLYIYIPISLFLSFFLHLEIIQNSYLLFKNIFIAYIVRNGFFLATILFFYFTNYKISLVLLAYSQLFAILIATIISYFLNRKIIIWGTLKWNTLKQLFHYGKFTFGANLSSILFKNIDQILLPTFLSPVAVAIYNPAIRITNLVEVPTITVASIFFPESVRRMKEEGSNVIKQLFEKSIGLLLLIMLPIVVFIFILAKPIILLIASDKYLATIPVLQILIFYALFLPFLRQFGQLLDSINKPHINFRFVVISIIINLSINLLLIPLYGVTGAAIGTLSAYIITFLINFWYLQKKYYISIVMIFKNSWYYLKQLIWYVKSHNIFTEYKNAEK